MGSPSDSELLAFSIGLGGLAAALVLPQQFPQFLEPYDLRLRYLGNVFFWIGMALAAATLVRWLWRLIRRASIVVVIPPIAERLVTFDNVAAASNDLREICTKGQSVIGGNHASEDLLRQRIAKCPDIVTKITNGKRPNAVCAYYIMYPLTMTGVNRIEGGKVRTGKDLTDKDIAVCFDRAKGLYISMLYGETGFAKAAALFFLKAHVMTLRKGNSMMCRCYGKPSTPDGRRLLAKFMFKPLHGPDSIWALRY